LGSALQVCSFSEPSALHEDLRLAFLWAEAEQPRLDKLQRRAGWPWLVRHAFEGERRRLLLEVKRPRTWSSALGEVASGGLRATPVDSAEGLIDEGMAFHNCIASYILECQRSRQRIFAVRERQCGRRVAVIRIDYDGTAGRWVLNDVLGIANAPVCDQVRVFAAELARTYNERMAGAMHDYEGRGDVHDEALCALEACDVRGGSCREPAD
jgi:hypothetical protein